MKQVDNLRIHLHKNRSDMGAAAAAMVADRIRLLLQRQEQLNIVFAAAPSQQEFLEALAADASIEWERINAFHMDEYIGLDAAAPQGFGNFLKARLFAKVPFRSVHYLNGSAADPLQECERYAALLQEGIDIVNMGIGENTHIAFNDPHVADFNDPQMVKVVDLDYACRQQQVNDGCFETFSQVPTHALTLTVTALMQGKYVYCIVPGPNKSSAVRHTLFDTISEKFPSTILRNHAQAVLFLDQDSAAQSFDRLAQLS